MIYVHNNNNLYICYFLLLAVAFDNIFMYIPREPNPNFLVNLTWRAVKGCVTKISSMDPHELIEIAQP